MVTLAVTLRPVATLTCSRHAPATLQDSKRQGLCMHERERRMEGLAERE